MNNAESLREGDVVMVVGKPNERVRTYSSETMIGTVWHISSQQVVVILKNHDLWWGKPYEVIPDFDADYDEDDYTEMDESDDFDESA